MNSSRRRPLHVESLEARQLLAADLEAMFSESPKQAIAPEYRSEAAPMAAQWLMSLADPPSTDVGPGDLVSEWLFDGAGTDAHEAPHGPSVVVQSQPTDQVPGGMIVTFAIPYDQTAIEQQWPATREHGFELYPLVLRQHVPRLIPSDPLFGQQWHLDNTGQSGGTAGVDANIVEAWDSYLGDDVVIAIVDDGVQFTHPDLGANYRADLSFDFNGNDSDPSPDLQVDFHGTSVAGVAAGIGDNEVGVSGAAPAADISAIRLIGGSTTDAIDATALQHGLDGVDIYNNSWGPQDIGSIAAQGQPGPLTLAAIEDGATLGRDGLGAIYVWAGGNGNLNLDNSNYDRFTNLRHTIAVGAINHDGRQAFYSEPGANLLLVAHSDGSESGITTTDLVGNPGYDTTDYTSTFGGTSSSTPLVSGVIALMLEANPNLSARDVQHVLVNSAAVTDAGDPDWSFNGAGHDINHKYGFGAIDAGAAVALAAAHPPVADEVTWQSTTQTVAQSIPDNSPVGVSSQINVPSDLLVEHVEVNFAATHTYRGDLRLILTSPAGTQSVLADTHNDDGNNIDFTYSSTRHWGEFSQGEWTLTAIDTQAVDVGTFDDWQLTIYGTEDTSARLSIDDASGSEPDGSVTFTASLDQPAADAPVTFEVALVSGTATLGEDFDVPAVSEYTIPIDSQSVDIAVPIIDDELGEPAETFEIRLQQIVGARGADTVAVGTIVSEDIETVVVPAVDWTPVDPAGGRIVSKQIDASEVVPRSFASVEIQVDASSLSSLAAELSTPEGTLSGITAQWIDQQGNPVGDPVVPDTQSITLPTIDLGDADSWRLRLQSDDQHNVHVTLHGNVVLATAIPDTIVDLGVSEHPIANGDQRFAGTRMAAIGQASSGIEFGPGQGTFIDISATGTSLGLTDDGMANITTTVGNELVPAGTLRIGNNGGILVRDVGTLFPFNFAIPAFSISGTALLPYWDDLGGNQGDVYWEEREVNGVPTLIVQWDDLAYLQTPGNGGTFQVQVPSAGSDLVRYVYQDVDFGNATFNQGGSATIGIQSDGPLGHFAYSHNGNVGVSSGDTLVLRRDSGLYRFQAEADDSLEALVESALPGVPSPQLTLIDPDGAEVTTSGADSFLQHVATTTGEHQLRVDNAGGLFHLLVSVNSHADVEPNLASDGNARRLESGESAFGFLGSPLQLAVATEELATTTEGSSQRSEAPPIVRKTVNHVDHQSETTSEIRFLGSGLPPWESPMIIPHNVAAADTTNADQLGAGGTLGLNLLGEGFTVGVWEAGGVIRDTHRELAGRVTVHDFASVTSHATHVAGTIAAAGIDAAARGMAPLALLRSYDSSDMVNELRADAAVIDVTNHSYGFRAGWTVMDTANLGLNLGTADVWFGNLNESSSEDSSFGQYSQESAELDDVLADHPHVLTVFSAGNDRNDVFTNRLGDQTYVTFLESNPGNVTGYTGAGWYAVPNSGPTAAPGSDGNGGTGFDSLNFGPQIAKNALVVGAIQDATADPIDNASLTTTSFSSYGPTDDGRIKPDIVGNGASLYSSDSASDSDYGFKSGTSMSAPNVSGSAVLLKEHYENVFGSRPDAATTKATIIHTARDAGSPGPDYAHGWGLMDAAAAAEFLTTAVDPISPALVINERYDGDDYTITLDGSAGEPIWATLAWTDPASAVRSSGLDDPTPALVHDLDLWATNETGDIFYPWTLDPANPSADAVQTFANRVDNVEQVLFTPPEDGIYTIHVGANGDVNGQDFALLISGQPELAPPPTDFFADEFDLSIPGGQQLSVLASRVESLASSDPEMSVQLTLFDDGGTEVASGAVGETSTLNYVSSDTAEYVLRIESAVDSSAQAGSGDYALTVQIGPPSDTIAPTVVDVLVASSQWEPAMLSAADPEFSQGVPLGVDDVDLPTLPWPNLDRIAIRFSEDVGGSFAPEHFQLLGTTPRDYADGSTVTYLPDQSTAVIELATPFNVDILRLAVSSAITDAAGNSLDGDASGGPPEAFQMLLRMLPADTNNDGFVGSGDLQPFDGTFSSQPGDDSYSARIDLDGNAFISGGDLQPIGTFFADQLPSGSPPPFSFASESEERSAVPAVEPTSARNSSVDWPIYRDRFSAAFATQVGDEGFDADLDRNQDGWIGSGDLLGLEPSPSAADLNIASADRYFSGYGEGSDG